MDSIESYLRKLIVASVGAADLGCEKLGKLLDECVAHFPPESEYEHDDERIRVAVIGKPNVGKREALLQKLLAKKEAD